MKTKPDILDILNRAGASSPGRWTYGQQYEQLDPGSWLAANGVIIMSDDVELSKENGDFITNARADVFALANYAFQLEATIADVDFRERDCISGNAFDRIAELERQVEKLEAQLERAATELESLP